MRVTIRRATQNDCEPLMRLWKEISDYHAALDPIFALAPDAAKYYRENLARILDDENWRVLLADDEGDVVGFIAGATREMPPVFVTKRTGHVSDLLVTARCRRRGVGEQLYRAMTEWFHERGVTIVELSVAACNPTAVPFWRKMGFGDYMLRMRTEIKQFQTPALA